MFLLDTNVISELRRAKPHGALLAWFETLKDDDISIPAVVLGEISQSIELTRRVHEARAVNLSGWLDKVSSQFAILPATGPIFRIWGKLMAKTPLHQSTDALIAATALHHDLTVVTRNVRDFTAFGVLVANPFARTR